ncbi:Heat shock 70 kDa protein-like [Oopsacas minuta]|uniref:Heat shock 70 kDa protein-like n=1 Tax=Oopsacas minuta TaxID=111878 RepID=A0AAV7JZC7_9METZ|nr:Heat shock 70 kDa protein-like [Oopsacas minuta]
MAERPDFLDYFDEDLAFPGVKKGNIDPRSSSPPPISNLDKIFDSGYVESVVPDTNIDLFFDTRTEITSPPQVPASKSRNTPVIGIDLGTTYSCVSVWEGSAPQVIQNSSGNRTTPSWVCFPSSSSVEVLVGEAAQSKANKFMRNTVYDSKRLIGRKYFDTTVQEKLASWPFSIKELDGMCSIQLEGSDEILTPEEISAYILVKMKNTAEDYLGCPVSRAVVTIPAYFNDAQRQATKDACKMAGLEVLRIINEPTAAAVAYGLTKGVGENGKRTLLVFDFGGGTLDVTTLLIDDKVFDIKSTCGDTQLGGQDVDENLVKYFLPKVQAEFGVDISGNAKSMKKLKEACRDLKHQLSHSLTASRDIESLVNGEDFEITLTRDEFDTVSKPLLEKCLIPVESALRDAGLKAESLDEVLLIGGSTRIVAVQKMLENYLKGVPISKRINPDEAVSMGAAIQGANLSLNIEEKTGGHKLNGLTLMDITGKSLGIAVSGGKMSVIVKRNTTIPYSHTKMYRNDEDYQLEAKIEVFEGENDLIKDNRHLGTFILPGLPPRLRGKVKIGVSFTVTADGILEVTANVMVEGGESKRLVIQKNKGLLSDSDIELIGLKIEKWETKCKANKINL